MVVVFVRRIKQKEHLGSVQTKWLIDLLKKSKPSALIVGDQFWWLPHILVLRRLHPVEFEVLAQLRNLKLPIYFMSGDRHCSEIMNIPKNILAQSIRLKLPVVGSIPVLSQDHLKASQTPGKSSELMENKF